MSRSDGSSGTGIVYLVKGLLGVCDRFMCPGYQGSEAVSYEPETWLCLLTRRP